MKINLAENLLRFGVKNLSESDYKKIQEQTAAKISIAPINISRKFGTSATPVVINDLEGYLGVRTFKGAEYWFLSGKVVTCTGETDMTNLLIGSSGAISDDTYTQKVQLHLIVTELGNAVSSARKVTTTPESGKMQADVSTMKAKMLRDISLDKYLNNTAYIAALILRSLQIDMKLRESVENVLFPKVVEIIGLLNISSVYTNKLNVERDKQTVYNYFTALGGKLV